MKMKKYSLIFFIKQSLNGLFRNGVMSLTSVFILTSCLILMGCFGLLMYNTNTNLEQLDGLMNTIVFIIDSDYDSEEDIDRITSEIAALPNVRRIELITRGQALHDTLDMLRDRVDDASLIDDEDFLVLVEEHHTIPDAVNIEYYDVRELDTLKFLLSAIPGFDDYRCSAEAAQFVVDLSNVVMAILIWFLVVLFAIAIFIILNTVKLSVHSRRDEITVMRYIGATNFFILFPFLLEGVIIGIVSAGVSYLVMQHIYSLAIGTLNQMIAGLNFVNFAEISLVVFVIFVSVGVLCGLLGSSVSAQKHLRA